MREQPSRITESPNRPPPPSPLVALTILPKAATLHGPDSRQRLVVLGRAADGSLCDVTAQATFAVRTPKVLAIKEGVVTPLADGTGKVVATLGKLATAREIAVRDFGKRPPASLALDVLPVLTKAGCNQGACHGAQMGKAGLKLSLLGYDAHLDFEAIIKKDNGRLVDLKNPENSLLLKKPAYQVQHAGGQRLTKGSDGYNVLLRWIREGAKEPDDKVGLKSLNVEPAETVFPAKGARQQLLVTAAFTDGTTRDVTHLARAMSSDDAVAAVDGNAVVTAQGGGDATVSVDFLGEVRPARFMTPVSNVAVTKEMLPPSNFIDALVFQNLQQLRIQPSGLCSDSEFLRRAYLDASGLPPTPDEARAFLQDKDPGKRAKLIDRLLDSTDWADLQTLRMADALRINPLLLQEEGADAFYRWINRRMRENQPYNEFIRELITSRGSTYRVGPANYYRVAQDTEQVAETTAQVFLGTRMQCAKCHNHPLERLSQKEYYEFAAFFARVGRKGGPEFAEEQVVVRNWGEVQHPRTKQNMQPRFLRAEPARIEDGTDRRAVLADWLASPRNLQVARVAVNRLWAGFFGRGIVDPVDDFRVSNPPANAPLLEALARDFIRHGWDLKHTARLIMNSRAYQLSSVVTPTNKGDTRHFARALPRRMGAEQLLDAIGRITGKPDAFWGMPRGTRAVQVRWGTGGSYFLEVFGRPKREILCACERDMGANLSQSLHLINSGNLNGKVAAEDGRLGQLLKANTPDRRIVEELYLASLSRFPTRQEHGLAVKALAGKKDAERRQTFEDLFWALLNSQEFLFIH